MEILGHYLFLSTCGYLTAFLCLALGFLVLHANPRSQSCRVAFLLNISVATWAFFYATMYHVTSQGFGILASQLLTFGTVTLCSTFTHLVLIVVNRSQKQKTLIVSNYFIGIVLSVLIFTSRSMIEGVSPKLDFPAYTDGGTLYWLIPVYLFSNVTYSVFILTNSLKTMRGYKKSQVILFLTATLIGFVSGIPAFLMVLDIPIKPITTPLVTLYPVILTYAIVKHRFLDIRKLIKKTLIFSLLFVALLIFVSVILFILKEVISIWIGIPTKLSQGIAIALAIALYGPLKTGLSRVTNNILFQCSQNPEIIFHRLSNEIFHFLETEKLIPEVTHRIAEILALDRIGFYLRSKKIPQIFEVRAKIGRLRKKHIHQTKQLVQYLETTRDYLVNPHTQRESRVGSKQKTPFALANMKEIKKQATIELASIGGVAAFPVFIQDGLQAILIIGRKKSDAPWSEEEFQILKSFTRHLSLALGNAEYAEEIRQSREKISLSERDASAGALIAGVEHEVKNPLSAIALNISALRANLRDQKFLTLQPRVIENEVTEILNLSRQYVNRIDNIICHISDLAHSIPLKIQDGIQPRSIAEKAIQMLKKNGDGVQSHIRNEIAPHISIVCDPDALYEIFVNLIRNAQHAVTEEGEIVLQGSTPNGETILHVRDTGVGIPQGHLAKIFEPFYTTKRKKNNNKAVGSGMGLFIVRQLMQGMGGYIEVRSKDGKGSEFRLHFPSLEPTLKEAA